MRTWGGQVAFVGLGLVLVVLSFFVGVGSAPDRWVRPERGFAGPGPFLGHVPLPPKHFVPRPDGYFYQHLLHHLAAAGREQDRQTLLVDFDWLYAKLSATDVTGVLADYSDPGQEQAMAALQGALQLAAQVLAHDPRQLPAQLVGRLDDHHDPAVRALVAQARRFDGSPWLCPVTRTSFHRPGPLKPGFLTPAR